MNGFRDNPVGLALAGFSGFVVLVGLVLAWLWTRPVTAPPADPAAVADVRAPAGASAVELEPVSAYRVITDRPLFSETRRPMVGDAPVEEVELAKPDSFSPPPEARLTGIVITPDRKMATLMPTDGGKPLLAIEGQSLGDEYDIWEVRSIEPRSIVMVSRAGRELTMELVVHDSEIAEPPRPQPPPAAMDETADAEDGTEGDDEPLSRAEQIRQRIAERREELRRQQEERAAEEAMQESRQESSAASNPRADYAQAISSMMRTRQQRDANEDDNDNDKDNEN